MNWLHNRRALPSVVLTGCLCCVGAGCGQGTGDEFRTYQQTVSDAAPTDDPPDAPLANEPADSVSGFDQEETDIAESTAATADSESTTVEGGDTGLPGEEEAVVETDVSVAEGPLTVGTTEGPSADANGGATGPRTIELLVAENEFQTEGPEGAVRVSYDDIDLLKVLNMDPVPRSAPSYFPGWLSGLEGQRIRIRGFMYPPPIESGIPAFLLARDNQICCFGKNPMPYDIIPVILRDDVTTDYINGRPFDVAGKFHVSVEMDLDDPTRVKTVYYIDDAIVIDK